MKPWDLSWKEGIRGTFSYKNQYAIYLCMVITVAAGLFSDLISDVRIHKQWRRIAVPAMFLIVTLCCLSYTLMNTSSRGALVSLIGATVLVIALHLVRHPEVLRRWLNIRTLLLGFISLVIVGVVFMQSSMYERFSEDKLKDNGRSLLRDTVVSVIQDYPAFGTGPGTYPSIQHLYKPEGLGNSHMSKRAHNDYLEAVASQGIMGGILLGAVLFYLLLKVFSFRQTPVNGLLVGCRAAVLAYLIQSTFDNNVSIFFLPTAFMFVLSIGFVLTRRFGEKVNSIT